MLEILGGALGVCGGRTPLRGPYPGLNIPRHDMGPGEVGMAPGGAVGMLSMTGRVWAALRVK